ncbi:hypothetical protein Tco_0459923 [Tanacetum coccineum]
MAMFGIITTQHKHGSLYLKKPTGSEGFQEIVDFLNGSHIRFALTKNPTIYVSLIEKFWQIATVKTVDNGEQEITAIIDGKEFTITEASVMRHLQLADVDGFSEEPTHLFPRMLAIQAEEGKGSGHPSEPQPPPSTAQPTHAEPIPNLTSKPIPNVADEAIYEEWDNRVERVTTTAASLDAEQASGNINRTQSLAMPNVSLPQGIGTGGSPRCQEAMGGSIAHTRSERLIIKVKKLEKTVKSSKARRTTKIVVSDDKEEDPSKQQRSMIEEIDQDAGVTLVTPTQVSAHGEVHSQEDQPEDQLGVFSAAKVLADAAKEKVNTYTRRRRAVSTGSGGIISTAGMVQEVNVSIPSPVVIKDKGKGKMKESEDEQIKRTKLQQEQDRIGHEVAVRLQEELDKEERQRMARVHKATQSFTEKEWENFIARVEADEELSRRLQAEERNKHNEVDQAKMLVDLINPRKKYFAAQKAEAKRNKPMAQAQQRNYLSNTWEVIHCSKTEDRGRASELAAGSSQATIIDYAEVGSSKRVAKAELDHEGNGYIKYGQKQDKKDKNPSTRMERARKTEAEGV